MGGSSLDRGARNMLSSLSSPAHLGAYIGDGGQSLGKLHAYYLLGRTREEGHTVWAKVASYLKGAEIGGGGGGLRISSKYFFVEGEYEYVIERRREV